MADLGHESQCVWRQWLRCSSLFCTNWVSNSQPPGGETAIWFTKVDPSSMAFPALSRQAQFHRIRRACFGRTQGTASLGNPSISHSLEENWYAVGPKLRTVGRFEVCVAAAFLLRGHSLSHSETHNSPDVILYPSHPFTDLHLLFQQIHFKISFLSLLSFQTLMKYGEYRAPAAQRPLW